MTDDDRLDDEYADTSTDDANASGEVVTRTGKVLTDEEIQKLADEAEEGYDLDKITPRTPAPKSVKSKRRKLGPIEGPRSYRDRY